MGMYVAVLLKSLREESPNDQSYFNDVSTLLYSGTVPKLSLSDADKTFFSGLLVNGGLLSGSDTEKNTPQRKRLARAAELFIERVADCDLETKESIYRALISKLTFTSYEIEEKNEVGMTFELMNSRGRHLTALELLKNYLMYWVSRHVNDQADRQTFEEKINVAWSETYKYLGRLPENPGPKYDDACLRVAWILAVNALPKEWHGYNGFKTRIPIRGLDEWETTCEFIDSFLELLPKVARNYAKVVWPTEKVLPFDVCSALEDIAHTGNAANAYPLLVALEMKREEGKLSEYDELTALRAIEQYAFRTFLWARKRSNAGKSQLYRFAKEFYEGKASVDVVLGNVRTLAETYCKIDDCRQGIRSLRDWYGRYPLLRCVLFGYEKKLVMERRKPGAKPSIGWDETGTMAKTVEHILPQTPDGKWLDIWKPEEIEECLNDIGNLVLTQDNSVYKNFDFDRKKWGENHSGNNPADANVRCYGNSLIAQEREIAQESDWTIDAERRRREKLVGFILERWCPNVGSVEALSDIDETDDEDDLGEGEPTLIEGGMQ